MCKSLTKSRRFSKSVGTPEHILFAEIFRFLNLLFETSFFKIPERAETVRNFPEPNWKTGRAVLKQPIFFWRFLEGNDCLDRTETFVQKHEKLNFFWFSSFCFWVFDCYRHVIFWENFYVVPSAVRGGVKRVLVYCEKLNGSKWSKIS